LNLKEKKNKRKENSNEIKRGRSSPRWSESTIHNSEERRRVELRRTYRVETEEKTVLRGKK